LLAAIRSCQYRVSSWVQLRVESRTSRLFAQCHGLWPEDATR
jgi:hypothetical protein